MQVTKTAINDRMQITHITAAMLSKVSALAIEMRATSRSVTTTVF